MPALQQSCYGYPVDTQRPYRGAFWHDASRTSPPAPPGPLTIISMAISSSGQLLAVHLMNAL